MSNFYLQQWMLALQVHHHSLSVHARLNLIGNLELVEYPTLTVNTIVEDPVA